MLPAPGRSVFGGRAGVFVACRQRTSAPDKKVAERRAAEQTPLPGLPGPDERPAAKTGEAELRQRVLQRCLETRAVAGPLRARDLAQRLASLDRRIDRHLVMQSGSSGGCILCADQAVEMSSPPSLCQSSLPNS